MRLRWACLGLFVVACSPAGSESLQTRASYGLSGQAMGVPAEGLRLGLGDEALRIDRDGAFAFASRLVEGDRYALQLQDVPASHACTLTPSEGVMPAANVDDLSLRCSPKPLSDCPTFDLQPWAFEPTWGRQGGVAALERFNDGRILTVGHTEREGRLVMTVWIIDATGDPDSLVTYIYPQVPAFIPAAVLDTPGGFYVVGSSPPGDEVHSWVVKLRGGWELDRNFGDVGVVELTADPERDCVNPGGSLRTVVDVQRAGDDGIWVVGAWSTPCQVTRPWFAKISGRETRAALSIYDPDVRFVWPVQTPAFDSFPQISGALLDDEGLVLVGQFWAEGRWQGALRRFNADAEVDVAFGLDGVRALSGFPPPRAGVRELAAHDLARDPQGGFVVVGQDILAQQPSAAEDAAAAMIWRGDGSAHLRLEPDPEVLRPQDGLQTVRAFSTGTVLVAGWRDTSQGGALAVGRLSSQGLDESLGPGGLWTMLEPEGRTWAGAPQVVEGTRGCTWFAANREGAPPVIGAFRAP